MSKISFEDSNTVVAIKNLNFFPPKRNEPFLITFFRAVFAFKRVCRWMKKKLNLRYLKRASHGTKRSALSFEISNSNKALYDAMCGKDVIRYIPSTSACEIIVPIVSMLQELVPQPDLSPKRHDVKRNVFRAVEKHLDGYYLKERTGRGSTALVERIKKSLIVKADPFQVHGKSSHKKISSVISSRENKAIETPVKPVEDSKEDLSDQPIPTSVFNPLESLLKASEDIMEFPSGTNIYFGSTIALQARHGGFLTFNNEIKASAFRPSLYTHFILKNSEDLTDNGIVKYGDALWFQAGHFDVLGAQYGSLVDQKRTITPRLINCRRAGMLKAQQYGRWIILNREQPMKTIGRPVSHHDKIILEQEWFYLASTSPSDNVSMYKTLSNSDEAMTSKKVNIFYPGDECAWKITLLKFGLSFDKAGENKRQQLQQRAMESIEASEIARVEKAPALLTSLNDSLPKHLTDDAIIENDLYRKRIPSEDQYNLHNIYINLSKNNFQTRYDPSKMLSHIYGADSKIVNYKKEVMKRKDQQEQLNIIADGGEPFQTEQNQEIFTSNPIDRAHNDYWDNAGRLLVSAEAWTSLNSSMTHFIAKSKEKRAKAVLIIQRCIRKFIARTFNYEREMKKVDDNCRMRLWLKEETRRKIVMQQALITNSPIPKHSNNSHNTTGANKPPHMTTTRIVKSSIHNKTTANALSIIDKIEMNLREMSITENNKNKIIEPPQQIDTNNDTNIFQYTEPRDTIKTKTMIKNKTLPSLEKLANTDILAVANINILDIESSNQNDDQMYENHRLNHRISKQNQQQRPHTANEVFRKSQKSNYDEYNEETYLRYRKKEKHKQQILRSKKLLDTSNGRELYGLPSDVFEDTHTNINIKTGLKFLRAMSANPNIYDDVQARKRSFQTTNIRRNNSSTLHRK